MNLGREWLCQVYDQTLKQWGTPRKSEMSGSPAKGHIMHTIEAPISDYERCVIASKKVRWDIDRHVIRGRTLDASQKYLPDALSRANRLEFLTEAQQRFMSQIQGRTYANMFGLVERFINCKIL